MLASLPQQTAVKTKLLSNKVGALFMKPGTGKTRPTLEIVNSEYKEFLMSSIHPDLKRIFDYQWLRLQHIDDEDCFKYMVKRILLCD